MNTNKLPEIPSEYIEPYLTKFISSIIEFVPSAKTEEELKKANGIGWTITEIKQWVKGVEIFVSLTCGIHARLAMSNEYYNRWKDIPDEELKKICHSIVYGEPEQQD